jgi:hypothetical protein
MRGEGAVEAAGALMIGVKRIWIEDEITKFVDPYLAVVLVLHGVSTAHRGTASRTRVSV